MHHLRTTVILTRPQGKNQGLQMRFEQAGLRVTTLPALTLQRIAITGPVPDPAAFDLVFFVSGFAVDCFLICWLSKACNGRKGCMPVV
ncbi:uroporphyrinogen-III synthase [Advenella kashmirensis]|uniref:hypothetical protein n=1 Tax=Advenella kashmirensis TaxID=310575 RepID=UPI0005A0BC75|nr:hypothetical protein [Advenella kashmirensis]